MLCTQVLPEQNLFLCQDIHYALGCILCIQVYPTNQLQHTYIHRRIISLDMFNYNLTRFLLPDIGFLANLVNLIIVNQQQLLRVFHVHRHSQLQQSTNPLFLWRREHLLASFFPSRFLIILMAASLRFFPVQQKFMASLA